MRERVEVRSDGRTRKRAAGKRAEPPLWPFVRACTHCGRPFPAFSPPYEVSHSAASATLYIFLMAAACELKAPELVMTDAWWPSAVTTVSDM